MLSARLKSLAVFVAAVFLIGGVTCSQEVRLLADSLGDAHMEEDFCFVSFGCWGGLNKATQKRVANVMGKVVAESTTPTLFAIAAGDNFYKKGVASVDDPRFFSTFDDVYSHPSLASLPFLVALGNHDYRGNFFAQVNYTNYQLRAGSRATGRWYLPEAYYVKRVHRDMVVFVLDGPLLERCANNGDTSPRCWDNGAQKVVIEKALEANKDVLWKVVVCHYPLHANGPHVNFDWLIRWLQPLLEKYCVDLYINADNHYLQVSMLNGVAYVNSGGGAGFGVRHLPSNKNYKKNPHSKFIAFEDGVFFHCINGKNRTIQTIAVNHNSEVRFHFESSLGPTCRHGPAKAKSEQQRIRSSGFDTTAEHVADAVSPPHDTGKKVRSMERVFVDNVPPHQKIDPTAPGVLSITIGVLAAALVIMGVVSLASSRQSDGRLSKWLKSG